MKTLNRIIVVAVLLLGLAACSLGQSNGPKLVKTEELRGEKDGHLLGIITTYYIGTTLYESDDLLGILATYADSTIIAFALQENPQEVTVRRILGLAPNGILVIPEKLICNGVTYKITGIDVNIFGFGADIINVTKVVIPNSMTCIGDYAFKDCTGLTSITIPNSVTSIGKGAFAGCGSLTSITIPNSVTSIGKGAFAGCGSLTSITIPNSVTSIGKGSFSDCGSLTSITIPNGVTSIEELAFCGCSSLTSITIPNSVTSIEYEAFIGCSSLTSITIPNGVTSIDDEAFMDCRNLTSVIIENPNLEIDLWNVFKHCDKLERSNVVYQNATNANNGEANKNNSQTNPGQVNKENTTTQTNESNSNSEAEIFTIVEQMPSFPGGDKSVNEFISNNIIYPQAALEKGIQGRVFVSFVVEPDGSLSDVKATRGIGGGCDEEAVRVIKSMPKWEPGKQKGQVVRVSYNLPVNFRLPN